MDLPVKQPDKKFITVDNFVKWFDERSWGTEKGSLGLAKQTVGKLVQYDEFDKQAKTLQSK